MRKKIKGYLKNITEENLSEINTKCIHDKNKISYVDGSIKHKIVYYDNEVVLERESDDFHHVMSFKKNKKTVSQYTLKETGITLEIPIETKQLVSTDNYIKLEYTVIDSMNTYEYEVKVDENEY